MIVVDSCVRDGAGGSPTAVVVEDGTLSDEERRAIVRASGASHGGFVHGDDVRFFTAAGELANCGHGAIAVQAVLPQRPLRVGGRVLDATVTERPDGVEVWFDQAAIELGEATGCDDLLTALGLAPDRAGDLRVASPGTPRLLVAVRGRRTLLGLRPDFGRLARACRRRGYLGCFAYVHGPTVTARMFAPAIGVDEDIVNANSAGCLAAHLFDAHGDGSVEVHQGDVLGRPSAVHATADGVTARIGGRVLPVSSAQPPGRRCWSGRGSR